MNANAIKRRAAAVFDTIGINTAGFALQRFLFSPFIRVVNYHDIAPEHAASFQSHLAYYSTQFVNVDETALRAFLKGSAWPHKKPGIIISFDDGLTSHVETAAPLLDKFGFTGWFFVPAERVATGDENTEAGNEDNALTPEQVGYLDEHHIVGCHTTTHCRLSAELPDEKLRFETLGAKAILEKALGHDINIFCWVGGEEFAYSKQAADFVRQGYDLSFMTNNAIVRAGTQPLQIQRTNIEAENPLSLVRFQLAGLLDLMYYPKRKRVNELTK